MTQAPHSVVVGTAGHIDHGKSSLVKRLTGTDPDRLPEERERGITIDLGFAHTTLDGVTFSFVDVPGHERFVHNMLAGATGIDLVLLVVAADEAVMPQTREHLWICRLLGLTHGVVALTRIDLAEDGMADLAEADVRALTAGTFLEGAPIIRVSSVTGVGIDALEAALLAVARQLVPRPAGPWPRLAIDRVFAARGFGTVVTGTLQGGALAVGDALVAIPGGQTGRVRGLQVHGAAVTHASPQQRVAVNLHGLERETLRRGLVLVPPGCEVVTHVFDARVEVVDDVPRPLADGQRVHVHHGTAEVLGRLRVPAPGKLEAGESGPCQIRLESPLALLPGDRFVLRQYSPLITLGGGVVLALDPPRLKRSDDRWRDRCARLALGDPATRLSVATQDADLRGVAFDVDAARLALSPADARALAARLVEQGHAVVLGNERVVTRAACDERRRALEAALAAHHRAHPLDPGPSPERLRGVLAPAWGAEGFAAFLARVAREGSVSMTADAVRLASRTAETQGEGADVLRRITQVLAPRGLDALDEKSLVAAAELGAKARDLLGFAARQGAAMRLAGDLWIGGKAWQELVERLHAEVRAGRDRIDVATFKELFGLTRRVAIPLLERLDDLRVTQRVGNERRIRPPG